MTVMTDREGAIVGICHAGYRAGSRSALEFEAEAAYGAIQDAGLSVKDIDGIATVGVSTKFGATSLAEYLGISPVWVDTTHVGGASYQAFTAKASAAIAEGTARVILLSYGSDQRSGVRRSLSSAEVDDVPLTRYDVPHAPLLPISAYAFAAQRYFDTYGVTADDLAEVAIAAREWARINPEAYHFGAAPLSIADVAASPMVSSPLRQRDCCLVTDGAGAIIMTSVAMARSLAHPVIRVLGSGFVSSHRSVSQMPDVLRTAGRVSAARALEQAGLSANAIDVIELYDSFTITVLLGLEAIGLCGEGEAAAFVKGGTLGPGGRRPVNTDGGGLASGHAGVNSLFLIIEAVRQLRGAAGARQLTNHETALCHGVGGYLSTFGSLVLGRE